VQSQGVNNTPVTPTSAGANSGSSSFPAANIAVVHGTEVFIGPFLGMQFGE
jgi:hypothetical protein